MKTAVHITLLSLWICALTVPPLVNILSNGENHVIVMSLGEEEQSKEGKKDVSEEKIVPEDVNADIAIFNSDSSLATGNYLLGSSSHTLEIPLPPPEHNV